MRCHEPQFQSVFGDDTGKGGDLISGEKILKMSKREVINPLLLYVSMISVYTKQHILYTVNKYLYTLETNDSDYWEVLL